MILDYFALGLLFFVGFVIFYGIIIIHDIPYEIAKARNHPQQDALHVAGWISLFTLHAIWPFLWIWATLYREDRGWGFMPQQKEEELKIKELKNDLMLIQEKLKLSLNQQEAIIQAAKADVCAWQEKISVIESELTILKKISKEDPKEI